jgi:hypothetical protein
MSMYDTRTPSYTIAQIEHGINYWRNREPSKADAALCAPARKLTDAYGAMIYERAESIDATDLTAEQIEALTEALFPKN